MTNTNTNSTAAALALRESGFENVRYVFADTGWEAKETYEHLELLEKKLGDDSYLRKQKLEHSSWFSRARLEEVCGGVEELPEGAP